MKRSNWKRAVETAEKVGSPNCRSIDIDSYVQSQALAKNPDNYKAQFRKGKAQAEMGYIEKSLSTLEDLLKKDESRQL